MTDGSVDPKHTPYDILSVKDAEKRFFNNSSFLSKLKGYHLVMMWTKHFDT